MVIKLSTNLIGKDHDKRDDYGGHRIELYTSV